MFADDPTKTLPKSIGDEVIVTACARSSYWSPASQVLWKVTSKPGLTDICIMAAFSPGEIGGAYAIQILSIGKTGR